LLLLLLLLQRAENIEPEDIIDVLIKCSCIDDALSTAQVILTSIEELNMNNERIKMNVEGNGTASSQALF
jgi:hypothetical protein